MFQEYKFSDQPVVRCQDHTVSGEYFDLYKAEDMDLLITLPRPDPSRLQDYYNSQEYISHTDSSSTLTERLYQLVKQYMLGKKLTWINFEKTVPGKILDIGAGTGDFLLAARKRGWDVAGVEPNYKARKLAEVKGLPLFEDSSALPDAQFDVISMWHVLEHVPDLKKQIDELSRLLKPDGLLLVAVPNYKSFDAEVYQDYWAAYDVPRHLYHFSPGSIKKIFELGGFKLLSKKALPFDAFYVSILSEKNKAGSTNLLRALWIGILSNFKAMKSGNYSSITYLLKKI